MKKKEFIEPEVLVHEMRKVFTQSVVIDSTGAEIPDSGDGGGDAPIRLNTLDAPEDVSGMKQSMWE